MPFVATALRMNSGLDQLYTGHTGYVLFLLLSWWFKLMALLGVVGTSTLEGLPPPLSDAFEPAYRDLVFAARYFIAMFAGVFAVLFYRLCLALTAEQTTAFLVSLVLAASRPLGTQAMMIYTELPSTFFLLAGFCVIAVPGHSAKPLQRMFLIGFFVTLAMMSKMQAIGYVLGIAVLALGFGPIRNNVAWPLESQATRWLRILVSLALIVPAAHMIATSVIWNTIDGASTNGWYHMILILLICSIIYLWGWIYHVPVVMRFDAMLALALGIAVAWYGHLIHHTLVITEKLANFLDHLYFLSSMALHEVSSDEAVDGLVKFGTLYRRAMDALGDLFTARFVISDVRTQAWEMMTLPILLGGLLLLYRRQYRTAIMVLLLSGFSMAAELFSRLYQFSPKHQIYSTPWLLIAAALFGAYLFKALNGVSRIVMIGLCCGWIAVTGWGALLPDMVAHQDINRAYGEAIGYAPSLAEGFKKIITQTEAAQ